MSWLNFPILVLILASCGRCEDKVAAAKRRKSAKLREMCREAGLDSLPRYIYIRAFKRERELELWGAIQNDQSMKLVATYAIAAMSGNLGPKRREGDRQVPEGCYRIDRYNPQSSYHLSLGLNYPNESDRHFADPAHPGGDIFIHGAAVSIGCLAMTDDKIEEIYLLALSGRRAGVAVHIFPTRLTARGIASLPRDVSAETRQLWQELATVYSAFEKTRKTPKVRVDKSGRYVVHS